MTIKAFACNNKISASKAKAMAPYIDGASQCPCCKKWIVPHDARPIYIPDKRKYSVCARPYCYVLDAIALGMELKSDVSNINGDIVKTVVRELRKNGLIVIIDGREKNSLYHLDYMISLEYANWQERKNEEKSKLICEIIIAGLNATTELAKVVSKAKNH